jgi:hypothetical protein
LLFFCLAHLCSFVSCNMSKLPIASMNILLVLPFLISCTSSPCICLLADFYLIRILKCPGWDRDSLNCSGGTSLRFGLKKSNLFGIFAGERMDSNRYPWDSNLFWDSLFLSSHIFVAFQSDKTSYTTYFTVDITFLLL